MTWLVPLNIAVDAALAFIVIWNWDGSTESDLRRVPTEEGAAAGRRQVVLDVPAGQEEGS